MGQCLCWGNDQLPNRLGIPNSESFMNCPSPTPVYTLCRGENPALLCLPDLTVSPSSPRSALQVLHKACEVARRHNYFPGGVALIWATYYESCIGSEQSFINEWNAMQDLESTRPDSPALFVDK